MMSIRIRGSDGESDFKITFTCPSCGTWETLFRSMPRNCLKCGERVPNLFTLVYGKKARADWHRGNEYKGI